MQESQRKKRKWILVSGILIFGVVMFLAIRFLPEKSTLPSSRGLNTLLPEAKPKQEDSTKLSFYEQGREEKGKGDSFGEWGLSPESSSLPTYLQPGHGAASPFTPPDKDSNEAKMYRKLTEIERRMQQPRTAASPTRVKKETSLGLTGDLNRLERLMQQPGKKEGDPELEALNTMMEKILDIQHPERVREKRPAAEGEEEAVHAVRGSEEGPSLSLLTFAPVNRGEPEGNGGIQPKKPFFSSLIEAVVPSSQTISDHTVVKLQLQNAIVVKGIRLPPGTLLFGSASLEGHRLKIAVSNITYQQAFLPVRLRVYDLDGLEGISVPTRSPQEDAKESAVNALARIGLSTGSSSLKTQAAGAGLQTARTFLTRKARATKLTLPEGYQVFLKDCANNY